METEKLFKIYYNDYPVDILDKNKRLELLPLTKDSMKKYLNDLWEYSNNVSFYKFLEYEPFIWSFPSNCFFPKFLPFVFACLYWSMDRVK